jgi:hypothetical protein
MAGSNENQLCVHGRCDACPECVLSSKNDLIAGQLPRAEREALIAAIALRVQQAGDMPDLPAEEALWLLREINEQRNEIEELRKLVNPVETQPAASNEQCNHRGFSAVTMRMQREAQGNPDSCPWCDSERLRAAFAEARDAILNGRGPLEVTLDGGQTNAVLAVLDDAFSRESSPVETPARRDCDGCGLPATAACPHCDTPTCGKCANCEHAPEETSGGEAALRRVIDRHVRWRETAIGFLRQVIDGRGSEDEWPALADFLERSDSRMVESSSVEPSARTESDCSTGAGGVTLVQMAEKRPALQHGAKHD